MSELAIRMDDPVAAYRALAAFLREVAAVRKFSNGNDEELLNGAACVMDGMADDEELLRKAMIGLQNATKHEGKC